MSSSSTLLFLSAALPGALGLALPGNVGRLPALGFSTWNAYHCSVNATLVEQAAELMVSKGYKAAGYVYMNQDDCWSNINGRDNVTHQILPDYTRYPDGISGLASKMHALGLKFGIYSSAGEKTCAGYPASLGYEEIDAATFAAWGVDYLKYDNCGVPSYWADACYSCIPDTTFGRDFVNGTCTAKSDENSPLCSYKWPVDGTNYTQSYTALRYRIMSNALAAQNRTMFFSLCEWGTNEPWTWGNVTAQSWRTTNDISPSWERVAEILNMNSFLGSYGGFSGHNDPDLLEVGNGNLTAEENRSHFALWALMKAPLIIGTDLSTLSAANTAILLNKYLLAFNQDPVHGAAAAPYKWGVNPNYSFNATNPAEYWSGSSVNGTMVAMLNTLNHTRSMTATFSEIPHLKSGSTYRVINAWNGKDMGCISKSVTMKVKAHDTAVLLVQNKCGKTTTTTKAFQA